MRFLFKLNNFENIEALLHSYKCTYLCMIFQRWGRTENDIDSLFSRGQENEVNIFSMTKRNKEKSSLYFKKRFISSHSRHTVC